MGRGVGLIKETTFTMNTYGDIGQFCVLQKLWNPILKTYLQVDKESVRGRDKIKLINPVYLDAGRDKRKWHGLPRIYKDHLG